MTNTPIEPVVEPSYIEEDYEAPVVKTKVFVAPAVDYKEVLVKAMGMIKSGKHPETVINFIKAVL
jgi:hypothetical protein